jgi:hypothetical protein
MPSAWDLTQTSSFKTEAFKVNKEVAPFTPVTALKTGSQAFVPVFIPAEPVKIIEEIIVPKKSEEEIKIEKKLESLSKDDCKLEAVFQRLLTEPLCETLLMQFVEMVKPSSSENLPTIVSFNLSIA